MSLVLVRRDIAGAASRRAAVRARVALVVLTAACAPDRVGAPTTATPVPVTVTAALTAAQQQVVKGLSVEVTGPGMSTPIVANLSVSASTVNGTVNIPAGSNRVLTVHAFDAAAIETYRGTAILNVSPGTNVAITIALDPLSGGQPITIAIASYMVQIGPAASALAQGATQSLALWVTGSSGADVTPAAADVQWGSSNPAIASVTPSPSDPGVATLKALLQGTTTVSVSYKGIVATATVLVKPPQTGFTSVAAGDGFTCALDSMGGAWCWGDNSQSQLGDGKSVQGYPVTKPMPVVGGLAFAKLYAAGLFACGLTAAGEAYCWGDNRQGQLGAASSAQRLSTPTAVAGGLAFAMLSTGPVSACGLTTNGDVYCWGSDGGRLGTTASGAGYTPAPSAVVGGTGMKSISAGGSAYCALSTSSALSCWGAIDADFGLANVGQLTALFPSETWQQISVAWGGDWIGTQHEFACGLTTAGIARCWGGNMHGTLGDGTTTASSALVTVSGAQDFTSIATGPGFACGLRTSGAIACWGMNVNDRLGGVSTSLSTTPSPVNGGYTFTRVATGATHACGLRTDGAVMCWGDNAKGQLGNGTTVIGPSPVLVQP